MIPVILSDKIEVSRYAYRFVKDSMRYQTKFVLGLAAGFTPLLLYQEIINGFRRKEIDFSNVHTFNLDDYAGLPPSHPQSYHTFMQKHLFKHVNLKKENIYFLNGAADSPEKHCRDYERQIKNLGGIDLQVLGIGINAISDSMSRAFPWTQEPGWLCCIRERSKLPENILGVKLMCPAGPLRWASAQYLKPHISF